MHDRRNCTATLLHLFLSNVFFHIPFVFINYCRIFFYLCFYVVIVFNTLNFVMTQDVKVFMFLFRFCVFGVQTNMLSIVADLNSTQKKWQTG